MRISRFQFVAHVNGQQFPSGQGKSKQIAKREAAKITLLQLSQTDFDVC